MRIGISVRGCRGQEFWRDGASQHAVFLAALVARLPFVRSVMLVDVGSECRLPREVDAAAPGLRVVAQRHVAGEIDVIVDAVGGLDGDWLDRMRSRGCKVIGCGGASPMEGAHEAGRDRFDEVWLLPKDELTVPLLRTLYRCPVRVVPFVWSPMFVERRVATLEGRGTRYGYRSAREASGAGWRIVIHEPGVAAIREPGIPMLACEDAYRTNRDAISALHVLNARALNTPAQYALLAAAFDLVHDHRTTFHGPHDLVDFAGKHADAVFIHQQNGGDPYGYLGVLHGDYPLIHNSPSLLDAGYYYAGSDAQQGARVLLAALHCHDATLDAYRARSRSVFDAIDPFSDANLRAYAQALLSPHAS